jgi:hypothetical protein
MFVLLDAKVFFSACQNSNDEVNGGEKEDSDHSETKGPYILSVNFLVSIPGYTFIVLCFPALQDSDEEEDGEDGGEEDESDEEEDEETEEQMQIRDETETNLVNLRRTIYLTIMSSVDFEEAGHKLLKIHLAPGQEVCAHALFSHVQGRCPGCKALSIECIACD